MTKKRESSRAPTATTTSARRGVTKRAASRTSQEAGKSTRGTAAGLRKGAGSATKAKQMTSTTKSTQKELTKRGGPGRAGNASAQKKSQAPRAKTPMRGRGSKARAGA